MTQDRIRICIKQAGIIYKVTSIYLLSDGSFKLDVPYCKHENGLIRKVAFPAETYEQMKTIVSKDKITQAFHVKNRPQLSVHASGFVQFSGGGIISGIDKKTGLAKGMALQSVPLSTPICTGPTCGVLVWGLRKGFDTLEKTSSIDLVYSEEDFAPRIFPGDVNVNTYQVEVWVFPYDDYYIRTFGVGASGEELMRLSFPNFLHHPNKVFVMRVIHLKAINSFLAIMTSKVHTGFTDQSEFGFLLGGPSEKSTANPNEWIVMNAISPISAIGSWDEMLPTLDYPASLLQG
jgi:hypothetical protein